jgi:hypothetical protein
LIRFSLPQREVFGFVRVAFDNPSLSTRWNGRGEISGSCILLVPGELERARESLI